MSRRDPNSIANSLKTLSLCLIFVSVLAGCVGTSQPPKQILTTIHRTQLDQWETNQASSLSISFERPSGRGVLLGSFQNVLIQLHGVSVQTKFPSDTQYLITISMSICSNEEWISRLESQTKYDLANEEKAKNDPKIRQWLEFKKWSYSLSPEVSMREQDGERYYRRAFKNDKGDFVEISAEYVPIEKNKITEDDAVIRRIMSSVRATQREGIGP